MKNVKMEQKNGKLVITVDLGQEHGLSKSGKSLIIGSTEGNERIAVGDDNVYVGVNVYKRA